jgi:hypothetical protein
MWERMKKRVIDNVAGFTIGIELIKVQLPMVTHNVKVRKGSREVCAVLCNFSLNLL